ncbi:hypothetical protein [Pseudomonas palmensis]|uniref:hypothetical protein n=1 Tax=Pseudomonas palmensis TaxID=2815362 RepID=UPI001AE99FBE|nr:hypothetical protein [Pseudomonas palmensis]
MSDLICRKSMQRCQHPGMCSPHGGCQPDKSEWQSGYDEGRRMGVKTALDERDQLKTENERLVSAIQAVINEVPSRVTRNDGNAPGHCHAVPGIWDEDNGDRAGTECGWCKVWAAAVAISKERGQ